MANRDNGVSSIARRGSSYFLRDVLRGRSVWLVTLVLAACSTSQEPVTRSRSDADARSRIGPSTVVAVDARSRQVDAVATVGPDPLLLTVASGQVWTLNFGNGTLSRVDPSTTESTTLEPSDPAVGLASDGDRLWAAVGSNKLVELNAMTGAEQQMIRVAKGRLFAPRDAGFVTTGKGSLWLTVPQLGSPGSPQSLWRIDQTTGTVLERLPLGPNPASPVSDDRYIWILTEEGLSRIDMGSLEHRMIRVGDEPFGLATGAGSVWIGDQSDNEVLRLDRETTRKISTVGIDAAVRGLAFGGGRVWVATEEGIAAIDPATNEVVANVALTDPVFDAGPIGIAYLDGSVWVSIE